MHKKPIIGSHYVPYRETGMRAFGLYLWWAFCVPPLTYILISMDIFWWLTILLNLVGYFIFRFGMISLGNSRVLIEFFGGATLLFSFILMFWLYGTKSGFVLILIFWMIVTPVVEILSRRINKNYD